MAASPRLPEMSVFIHMSHNMLMNQFLANVFIDLKISGFPLLLFSQWFLAWTTAIDSFQSLISSNPREVLFCANLKCPKVAFPKFFQCPQAEIQTFFFFLRFCLFMREKKRKSVSDQGWSRRRGTRRLGAEHGAQLGSPSYNPKIKN